MSQRTIIESIQKITGTQLRDNVTLIAANVDSVDEAKRTCNVTGITSKGAITIENVQLMSTIDDGIFLVPAIDSTVFVLYSTFNQPFVCLFSELKKIVLVAGENNATVQMDDSGLLLEIADTKVQISDGEIQFNDGSMGGMVKVVELVQKLNNLENVVNDLITKYNAHTHILTLSTGTGTAAPTTTSETQTLTPTQRGDIENNNITQG